MKYGNDDNDTSNKNKNKNQTKNNNKKNNPFKNVDVYVVRVKNGTTYMSKPCTHCVNSIKIAGIRRVYYSTGDYLSGEWKCENASDIVASLSSGNRNRNRNKNKK